MVSDDVILEQVEYSYDAGGNTVETVMRWRYHNAPSNQTGPLEDPSTTPKARVTYTASYPDALGRVIATADYGTNGGTALSRPDTVPARSDNVLVSITVYNDRGEAEVTADPAGLVTVVMSDDAGREVERVINPASGSSSSSSSSSGGCLASADTNVTTRTSYTPDGNVASITAVNPATGDQVTTYIYGTTLDDSDIATSSLKRYEDYPDSVGGSDRVAFTYNRQRQMTSLTDQNGTVHAFDFDKLGRATQDRITTLGSGVDGTVRRLATSYEVRGMRAELTSYDNATVGSGSIVNEVQFAYNDFGQLIADYQSHSGAVNTGSTPKVQYDYADGSANTIRPIGLTYPNGRVISYDYSTTGSMPDALSRVDAIKDGVTALAQYSYLGLGTFVITDYTEPDIKWVLNDPSGTNDPDTGDIYSGFDRFGRVKDNRWYNYGSAEDTDRIKYGYDRASNRIWRQNTVATSLGKAFDEFYWYDGIHRLKDMQRGTLNADKTGITPSTSTFAECWGLDATGNWNNYRQDDNGDGTWDMIQSRANNAVNEITGITETAGPSWVTPAYDAAGNMTTIPKPADPTQSYTNIYDAWNRLVAVKEDGNFVAEHQYDPSTRRTIQKTYSSGTLSETRHLYYTEISKWQVIEERVADSSSAERQFVRGLRYIDDLALRDRDTDANGSLDERLYALQDANWNVTCIVGPNGAAQERYAYSAYGIPIFLDASFDSSESSSFRWETLFCGGRWHQSPGVFEVRYRVLCPIIGAWTTRDPIGYFAGMNLFLYVSSMPLSRIDPLGLKEPTDPTDNGNCDSGEWFPHKLPTADLVCIDASQFKEIDNKPTGDIDGFLRDARRAYPGATPIRNFDEVLKAAEQQYNRNDQISITLIIIGHGATAQFNMGSGYLGDPGPNAPESEDIGQVLDLRNRSNRTRARFRSELPRYVQNVRFISCCTGRNDPNPKKIVAQGSELLKQLSSTQMEVVAPTKKCSFRKNDNEEWQLLMNGNATWNSSKKTQ